MALTRQPPRSLDLMPCEFSLWGYIRGRIVLPLPVSVNDLKQCITRVVANVDKEMLDYHIDICRVTKGSQIEHL
ncbi:hypothetical protein B7P43_G10000 [Cryptotermes secundus]|uniref:Uncharacterized protein n=1 Tax=Cryptotermes secundus TaxID=105785 RepID=A0A2J7RH14_9NEOP|nr:hypothetical protein B7P43_G10000 [Cryptotermes secundus]